MTEEEMIEKIQTRTFEQTLKIIYRYRDFFHEGIVLNEMPPEDYARLGAIVEECIATGKPYDNYMPYPDDENVMVDY